MNKEQIENIFQSCDFFAIMYTLLSIIHYLVYYFLVKLLSFSKQWLT